MITWLFGLPSATTLIVRENDPQTYLADGYVATLHWVTAVSLRNVKSIDYACQSCPHGIISKFGTATGLERLRFIWSDMNYVGINAGIRGFHPARSKLRELTVLPDTTYGGHFHHVFDRADLSSFTTLEVLRIPSLAFFEALACKTLRGDPDRAGFEDRTDIVHLLPPSLRSLLQHFFRKEISTVTPPSYQQSCISVTVLD
jgi:hypothetical protein